MTTKTIIAPIVHLNGTSKSGLIDPIEEALDAIREAYDKLKKCAPNGRDYYPYEQSQQALSRAQTEHRERLLALHNLQSELEAIWTAIEDREPMASFELTE